MNAISLNNLWSYLQGLTLTASNKKWLADHLYESAKIEELSTGVTDPLEALENIGSLVRSTGKTSEQLIDEYLTEKYAV